MTLLSTETITFKPAASERRMLYALAHPDDESFGPGGSILCYANAGVDVHLICGTRGECGTVDEHFLNGYADIAELRTAELLCAAKHLNLTALHLLNYRDSGMPGSSDNHHPRALAAASTEEVALRVAGLIRQIRPQVIVTFDPIGGYYHPDHIAIHLATVQAFTLAADPAFDDGQTPFQAERLYYSTIDRRIFRIGVTLLRLFRRNPRAFGRNGDIDLVKLAEVNFPVHVKLNIKAQTAAKSAAAACHASQGGPPQRGPISWLFRMLGQNETFMQAQPPVPDTYRSSDLWQGVN